MPKSYTRDEVSGWLIDLSMGRLDLREDNMAPASAALDFLEVSPAPSPADDQLSPHFTLSELTASDTATARGIDNTPDADQVEQLSDLANETLERIRVLCSRRSSSTACAGCRRSTTSPRRGSRVVSSSGPR